MKKLNRITIAAVLLISTQYSQTLMAVETVSEKTEIVVEKASNAVKKAYRSAKDSGCETVDGKINCLGKKIKHKAENISDEAATKLKEIKNKTN